MSNGQSNRGKGSEKPASTPPSSASPPGPRGMPGGGSEKPASTSPSVAPLPGKSPGAKTVGNGKRPPAGPSPVPNLFRRWDWIAFWITTAVVFLGYFYTLAPDVS